MAGSTPWNDQYLVGRGVESQIFKTYNQALEFDEPVSEDPGLQVFYELTSVTSTSDLMRQLNVSAAASIPSLGAFSGSAEFQLSNSTEINSFYTYGLVRVTVVKPPQVIRSPRLNSVALDALQSRGWDAFSKAYGREYIAGKVTGGTFYALVECETTSLTEQKNIRAEMNAAYGPFKAEAKVSSSLTETMSRVAINVKVYRSGGATPVPMSWEDMLQEARNYPAVVEQFPRPISALINDYQSSVPLPSVPADDSLAVIRKRDSLNDLGREYMRLREYGSTLRFITDRNLSDFDDYIDLDSVALNEKRKVFIKAQQDVANELDSIVTQAQLCEADIRECRAYKTSVETLELPTIGGELLNIKAMEEKIQAMEQALLAAGLIGGGPAKIAGDFIIQGNATVGTGGERVKTRLIDGKAHGHDGADALHLNWDNSHPVHIGGGKPASLFVSGGVSAGHDMQVTGKVGCAGYHPATGLPDGWGGGVHTWDVVARSAVGVANADRQVKIAMTSGGLWAEDDVNVDVWDVKARGGLYVYKKGTTEVVFTAQNNGYINAKVKKFSIDHPLRPNQAKLDHAAIEGPEIAVFYRGEACTNIDGFALVKLPPYFEALTRKEGRTVLATPILGDMGNSAGLTVSYVVNGTFTVCTLNGERRKQPFFWEVKAIRADVDELPVIVEKSDSF